MSRDDRIALEAVCFVSQDVGPCSLRLCLCVCVCVWDDRIAFLGIERELFSTAIEQSLLLTCAGIEVHVGS